MLPRSVDFLRIDINSGKVRKSVAIRQDDTVQRTLSFSVVNSGVPLDLTGLLFAEILIHKTDDTEVDNGCVIDGDSIQYTLRSNDVAALGTNLGQLMLTFDTGEVLTTPTFEIVVYQKVLDQRVQTSTNEYGAITDQLVLVNQYAIDAENSKNAAADSAEEAAATVTLVEGYASTAEDYMTSASEYASTAESEASQAASLLDSTSDYAAIASEYADVAASEAADAAVCTSTASEHMQSASEYASTAASEATNAESQAANASEHASSASEYASTAASEAADAASILESTSEYTASASEYASTAASEATNVATYIESASEYANSASEYASTAASEALDAAGYLSSTSEYLSSASEYAATAESEAIAGSNYLASTSEYTASASEHASTAGSQASLGANYLTSTSEYLGSASEYASFAASEAATASGEATAAESWAVGGTDTRTDEDINNAYYWYYQAYLIAQSLSGALRPMGTVAFANLPSLSSAAEGDMYNVSDQFTTTAYFEEGAGYVIPAGSNVYKTSGNKWDVLAGSPVTGVKGDSESIYRQGNVNITKANVGLANVRNEDIGDTDISAIGVNVKAAIKALNDIILALDTSNPTASGTATSFIDTVSQADGKLSATKKSIPDLGRGQKGLAPAAPSGTGTTKYLREDGSWQVPPDNNTNTTYSMTRDGTSVKLTPSSGTAESVSLDSLLTNLPTWTATATDDTYLIRRDTGGSASYGQIKFSTLWSYITGKNSAATSGGTTVTLCTTGDKYNWNNKASSSDLTALAARVTALEGKIGYPGSQA